MLPDFTPILTQLIPGVDSLGTALLAVFAALVGLLIVYGAGFRIMKALGIDPKTVKKRQQMERYRERYALQQAARDQVKRERAQQQEINRRRKKYETWRRSVGRPVR